jgi:5-methylcytosine-specific restriction endonuclease McrBC GTP-binding regulatory subunit McrB
MNYKIDEGRLGCLIEIYAEFLERNSDYIKQKNAKLEFFKEILNKINSDELTEEDIEKIFTKKEKKLDSGVAIKYKEREAKLKLINFLKTLVNFEEELRTKNKLDEVIDEFVKKWQPLIRGWKIGDALVTELLCVFYPDQYCIKNNEVKKMIEKLDKLGVLLVQEKKFYEDYDKLIEFERVILKSMQNNRKLQNVYHKIIGRTNMNYYDVDAFLYWIIDNKHEEKNKLEILNEQIEKCLERNSEDRRSIKSLANYFQYKGFYFDQPLITAFYSALKTKGFVILSGLTGTGKTKLAQLFAEIFEIEKIKERRDENYSTFTVQIYPYMLKYSRIYIPKRYNEILNLVDVEKEKNVKVVSGKDEEICKVVKYSSNPLYPYTLLLKGKVAKWFKDNFKEGDKLQIEIVPTEDNEDVILVLKKFEPDKIEKEKKPAHLFLPVRPDWRDTNALLGYYNPITREYESTKLLKFILDAIDNYNTNKNNASPYFIILDEMNLSHVEYYFADFLSVLESGRDENYWTKETIKLHNFEEPLLDNNEDEIPKEIKLPPNLYLIGSVNIDETTYMFSPKVLDRAFAIEFREVNLDDYNQFEIDRKKAKSIIESIRNGLLEDLRNKKNGQARFSGAVADKEEIKEALNWIKENKVRSEKSIFDKLKELNQILQPYDLHFGYRVLDEIALFIKYATSAPNEVGKLNLDQALDFAVLMKVLPKFHGPRQKLERPLWLVLNWCLKNAIEFKNKPFDDLIKGIWEKLSDQQKRPSIEDFTYVIQKLKLKLNNRSENVSQEANPESQTIDENQNQTAEETPESTSEAHQTEQTSKDEKAPIINKVKYPRTAIKVLTMLRQLYETGFTSFA